MSLAKLLISLRRIQLQKIETLQTKIFADGADDKEIIKLNEKNYIKGFTTNPSLMSKADIKNYEKMVAQPLNL